MENSKLFVGNLNYSLTEAELAEAFADFGEVLHCNIIQGKGFGFVELSSPEKCQEAIEAMDQKDLKGRPMRVALAKPRQPKP